MALIVAFALAVIAGGHSADLRAQTLTADGSVSWGIKGGPSTSQVVNGALVIGTALALTVAAPAIVGGASATIALGGRTLTVAASAVGPIAASMLRQAAAKGPLTGAMLALAVAMGSDASYDSASNSFQSAVDPNSAYPYGGYQWYVSSVVYAAANPLQACQSFFTNQVGGAGSYQVVSDSVNGGSTGYVCQTFNASGGSTNYRALNRTTSCYSGYVMQGDRCVQQNPQTAPASDAQLSSALQTPAALAKVWDAGGCPQKVTSYRDTLSADDPCAKIIGPQGGNGAWTPVTVPNGGQISLPTQTGTQTTVGADGKTITTTTATTPTAQVTPNTNPATLGANPVIVQTGSVVTKTVDDGTTQTTTTTTTTNPASVENPPEEASATFNAGEATLYTKKDKTMASVLSAFSTTVQQAPWYTATTGWFTVSVGSAVCPVWVVPKTDFTPAVDLSTVFCSQQALIIYGIAGMAVIVMAAWAAFRIAFL
ncbi:hypothetical protein [Cupriavidus laharis]|uniref:hypothetical protein n=1 Tax=Cupriavidus laharis TaxID=151654 RepID=UPI001CC50C2D|nr:hypothetical protein [Cupriavidus laharis]